MLSDISGRLALQLVLSVLLGSSKLAFQHHLKKGLVDFLHNPT